MRRYRIRRSCGHRAVGQVARHRIARFRRQSQRRSQRLAQANIACFSAEKYHSVNATITKEPAVIARAHSQFVGEVFHRLARLGDDAARRFVRDRRTKRRRVVRIATIGRHHTIACAALDFARIIGTKRHTTQRGQAGRARHHALTACRAHRTNSFAQSQRSRSCQRDAARFGDACIEGAPTDRQILREH